jgi:hypothetical protein
MPRPGPRRQPLAVKISDAARERVAARAVKRGLLRGNGEPNLSEMARIMLAYADQHMPENWQPRPRRGSSEESA